MKIIATDINNTLVSLLNNTQKELVSDLIWWSINSFCNVLIQNVSEHNLYIELWTPATADSVVIEKKKSVSFSNVDLSKINLLGSSEITNCAILIS